MSDVEELRATLECAKISKCEEEDGGRRCGGDHGQRLTKTRHGTNLQLVLNVGVETDLPGSTASRGMPKSKAETMETWPAKILPTKEGLFKRQRSSLRLTELDCWRASTILDMLELKLLESATMLVK